MPTKPTKRKKNEVTTFKDDSKSGIPYATRVLNHTSNLLALSKPDLNNPHAVELALENYFHLVQQDEVKPTVSGLAMALGVTTTTLRKYAHGESRVENREAVMKAWQTIEIFDEALMKEGLMPALTGIFYFKNNYGYTDKSTIVTGTDELTDEEIEKFYREKHEIVGEQ